MNTIIEELSSQWLECKLLEAEANRKRLEIEKALCEAAKEVIPAEGSATLGKIKVTTGFDRKWDTEVLTQIYRTKPPVFPFKVDWKEDRRTSRKLEVSEPSVMALFAPALTIKEKKPSFSYIADE